MSEYARGSALLRLFMVLMLMFQNQRFCNVVKVS